MGLLDSLESYWKLDETSGTRVDSHGSNDLTDNATVGSASGIIKTSADFVDVNGESLSHVDNASLSTDGTDFSLSLWFYLNTTTTGTEGIIGKYNNNDTTQFEYYFIYRTGSDDLVFAIFKDSGAANPSTGLVSASPARDTFIHAVITINNTTLVETLVLNDGTPVTATMDEAHTNDTVSDFTIGNLSTPPGGESFTNGRVDEVGFWKRALAPAEKTQLYNGGAGLPYPFSSPVFESSGIGRMPGYLSFGRI